MMNESETDAQTARDGVATRNGRLLKADEVVRLLRISRGTLDRAVRDGRLPAIRIGRCLRFRAADLDRL